MSLFRILRDEIVDPNVTASSVLRKAKILAASLEHAELTQWLADELGGYKVEESLPSYRRLKTALLGLFSGPHGATVADYPIPITYLPDYLQLSANDLPMAHPLREVEVMIAGGKELRHTLPTEAVLLSRDRIRLTGGFQLVEMHQPLSPALLEGIVDAVRNRFLEFLLGLQKLNPGLLKSDDAVDELPAEQVSQVFNVAIHGDHNIVTTNSAVREISIQSVQGDEFNSLSDYLRSIGVPDEDVSELEQAVDADGPRHDNGIGRHVTAWIGRALAKAVSGAWQISLTTAPEVLREAIFRYYGWK